MYFLLFQHVVFMLSFNDLRHKLIIFVCVSERQHINLKYKAVKELF